MDDKKEPKDKTEDNEEKYIRIETCSATDCTGLIASAPVDEQEAEIYDEIYGYNPQYYYDEEKMQKGRN